MANRLVMIRERLHLAGIDSTFRNEENREVTHSVIEAIREGEWDFEPVPCGPSHFQATQAIPGSAEKLSILCERIARGEPLWHPSDRRFFTEHRPGEHSSNQN